MGQHWQFRIRGKQRKAVDKGLLVQALIELRQQLAAEQPSHAASAPDVSTPPPTPADETERRS